MNIAGFFGSAISIAVGYVEGKAIYYVLFPLSFIQLPSTYTSEAKTDFRRSRGIPILLVARVNK